MNHLHIAVVIACTELDPDVGMLANPAFHSTKKGSSLTDTDSMRLGCIDIALPAVCTIGLVTLSIKNVFENSNNLFILNTGEFVTGIFT